MPLVETSSLIRDATDEGSGLCAFNVIHVETAEALVEAAERTGQGIILQISQNCAEFHGGLEPIGLATLAVARACSVPIAVHLDHAEDTNLAREAIDLGFGSVMYDGARLDYDANVAATIEMAKYAHERDKLVEAELGEIGGKKGAHALGVRTDPAEAVRFVSDTGVDLLAVAVGSSHAMTDRTAKLDLDLIMRLQESLSVPLVLHGSSGVSDSNIIAAISNGMVKINISTQLNRVFTERIREHLSENPAVVDSRKYLSAGREAIAAEAARLIRLISLRPENPNTTKP